eukprot:3288748-Rhodomonas_salina.3
MQERGAALPQRAERRRRNARGHDLFALVPGHDSVPCPQRAAHIDIALGRLVDVHYGQVVGLDEADAQKVHLLVRQVQAPHDGVHRLLRQVQHIRAKVAVPHRLLEDRGLVLDVGDVAVEVDVLDDVGGVDHLVLALLLRSAGGRGHAVSRCCVGRSLLGRPRLIRHARARGFEIHVRQDHVKHLLVHLERVQLLFCALVHGVPVDVEVVRVESRHHPRRLRVRLPFQEHLFVLLRDQVSHQLCAPLDPLEVLRDPLQRLLHRVLQVTQTALGAVSSPPAPLSALHRSVQQRCHLALEQHCVLRHQIVGVAPRRSPRQPLFLDLVCPLCHRLDVPRNLVDRGIFRGFCRFGGFGRWRSHN